MKSENGIQEKLTELDSEKAWLKERLCYVEWYNAHQVVIDIAKKIAKRAILEWVLR